jgi:protein SCO1/2
MLLRSVAWTAILLASIVVQCGVSATASKAVVDQRGRDFTLQALRGAPTVVTFVSAHCTDACPLVNAQIAQAARASLPSNTHYASITLDPERDTRADMANLANAFDANPSQWSFVSGTPAAIHALMKRFGVVAERGRSGYAKSHTTFIYVLDRQGRLAATILPSNHLQSILATEVSSL